VGALALLHGDEDEVEAVSDGCGEALDLQFASLVKMFDAI
jgi:hypothetical protein